MHGFSIDAITFYSVIFSVAFLATVTRAVRDRDWSSCGNLVGIGGTAGFLSVGVVCVLGPSLDDLEWNRWYWVGASALLGLLGKEQDKIARIIVGGMLKGFRGAIEDAEKGNKP